MAERKKLRIPMPILVEGRYDKAKLCGIVEGTILQTDGFGIFKQKEKLSLIRALAKEAGILVLTDSDGAGKTIRSYLSSALPKEQVFHIYIPQIAGKEKRKNTPSTEGTLGVEGMENDLLYELLLPFDRDTPKKERGGITKGDLYALGLTGTADASARRDKLSVALSLPAGMTSGALLSAANVLFDRETFLTKAEALLSSPEVTR